MSEVKLYLRNRTKYELTFSTSDDMKFTVAPRSPYTVSVNQGIRLWVSAKDTDLESDIWHYEIDKDISLDCSLYGKELKLHIGPAIHRN